MYLRRDVAAQDRVQSDGLDDVARVDPRVVGLVGEGQRDDALLEQIRLVYPGEAAGEYDLGAEESRLQRGVL